MNLRIIAANACPFNTYLYVVLCLYTNLYAILISPTLKINMLAIGL